MRGDDSGFSSKTVYDVLVATLERLPAASTGYPAATASRSSTSITSAATS